MTIWRKRWMIFKINKIKKKGKLKEKGKIKKKKKIMEQSTGWINGRKESVNK